MNLMQMGGSDTSYLLDTDAAGADKAIAALKPLLQGKVIGVQTSATQVQFLEKYFAGVVVDTRPPTPSSLTWLPAASMPRLTCRHRTQEITFVP